MAGDTPLAPAGWYADGTERHQYRYWDGRQWTEHVADDGVAALDFLETADPGQPPVQDATQAADLATPAADALGADEPTAALAESSPPGTDATSDTGAAGIDASTTPADTTPADTTPAGRSEGAARDASATSDDAVPAVPAVTGQSDHGPRSWTFRPWQAVAIAIVLALIASGIGIGIGIASQQSQIDDLSSKNDALASAKSRVTHERDAALQKVDDREAQREADQAKAARIAAEEKQAADQKAAADKAAADKVAAEQKAAADKAAAAAAAAEAKRNTIGPGVYAIGPDKNPGRYQTAGPSGSNPVGCYYAILNSPNTLDIATNNITDGPAIVDLAEGTYFDTSSCQTWQRIG